MTIKFTPKTYVATQQTMTLNRWREKNREKKKSKIVHPAQEMLGYKSAASQHVQQGLPRWGEYHKTITFALGKAFMNIAPATVPPAHLWDSLTWLDTCWSLKNYSVYSVRKKNGGGLT